MALSKPSSGTSLLTAGSAAASNVSGYSTGIDTSNAIQVAVEVILTYGAATLGGRLECFGSLDNTNWSTEPYAAYDIVLAASATTRQVFGVANSPRYVKFRVRDLDTSVAISAISINSAMQTVA